MRQTAQRATILAGLRASPHLLTAEELFQRLREQNPRLGRATVFRSLDLLVTEGLAQRFEKAGHVYAYTACSSDHHHHLVCQTCHRAAEIDESVIEPLVTSLAAAHGFVVAHSSLDFYGTCATCAAQHHGGRC